jgi:hypothetical protein
MAGFRNGVYTGKILKGAKRGGQRTGAGEIPRLARKAHNVAAGSSR